MGRKKFARKRRIRNFDNDPFIDMLANGYECVCENTHQRTEVLRYLDNKHFFDMGSTARYFLIHGSESDCSYINGIILENNFRYDRSTHDHKRERINRVGVIMADIGSDLTIGYQEFKTLTSGALMDKHFLEGLVGIIFSEVA